MFIVIYDYPNGEGKGSFGPAVGHITGYIIKS